MVDFSKFRIKTREEREAEEAARPACFVVTGSRDWTRAQPIQATMRRLHGAGFARMGHGAARGLDRLADAEARAFWSDDQIKSYPADWSRGNRAGIDRNYTMEREERPHLGVAFPLAASVGTWHMSVLVAQSAPVMVFLGGVQEEVVKQAKEYDIDPVSDRQCAVVAWVEEQVRKQVVRSRAMLDYVDVEMPDATKAWALLCPRGGGAIDRRGQAGIDALAYGTTIGDRRRIQ